MTQFYAYVHARPNTVDAHGIFYVGKGKGKRSHDLVSRNNHHTNVVNKHGVDNVLIGRIDCSSEETAFELEKGLIKCLRRMGVKLANMTDGGEGISGYRFSPEEKAAQSARIIEVRKDPELRRRHSIAMKNLFTDPEIRAKYAAASSLIQNTPEAKAKRSVISKGVALKLGREHYKRMSEIGTASPIWRAKVTIANKDPIKRAKHSAFVKGMYADPLRRKSLSATMKKRASDPSWRKAVSEGTRNALSSPEALQRRAVYFAARAMFLSRYGLRVQGNSLDKELLLAWYKENNDA